MHKIQDTRYKIQDTRYKIPYLTVLFLIGLGLRLYAAGVDAFLHDWDERFHALVARNMMERPFEPMLQREVLGEYDPYSWCCNTIWLHKQPLFLWQMALSMRVFGVSEWAMRLPSALTGALMVIFMYRMALLLTGRRDLGLWAAALMAFSGFQLELISGIRGMDHNDMALGFYVLGSFWAFSEREASDGGGWRLFWAILAGVFAGGAVLNKWLLGLAVYLPWGILTLADMWRAKRLWIARDFGISLLVCGLVFVPWQVYIMSRWPELAAHEFEFNRRHLTEALEGHSGTVFFYAESMGELMGSLVWVPMLAGVGYWLVKWREVRWRLGFSYGLIFAFVFIFLSFFVATKVKAHFFFVVPFGYMFVVGGIAAAGRKLGAVLGILALGLGVQAQFFMEYFEDREGARAAKLHNAEIYRNLRSHLPEGCTIVSNFPSFGHVEVQFYNPELRACHWGYSAAVLDSLAARGEWVSAFRSHGQYHINEATRRYPRLHIIDLDLR